MRWIAWALSFRGQLTKFGSSSSNSTRRRRKSSELADRVEWLKKYTLAGNFGVESFVFGGTALVPLAEALGVEVPGVTTTDVHSTGLIAARSASSPFAARWVAPVGQALQPDIASRLLDNPFRDSALAASRVVVAFRCVLAGRRQRKALVISGHICELFGGGGAADGMYLNPSLSPVVVHAMSCDNTQPTTKCLIFSTMLKPVQRPMHAEEDCLSDLFDVIARDSRPARPIGHNRTVEINKALPCRFFTRSGSDQQRWARRKSCLGLHDPLPVKVGTIRSLDNR